MFITRKKYEAAIAQAKKEAANEVYKRMDEEKYRRLVWEQIEKLGLRIEALEKSCVRRRVKGDTEEMLPF
ncbi:MAG: hypothetical protein ACI3V4_02550 [Faecousia sp.]